MSDLALYRKYRPETFADVVGQDHIVKVLEGALKAGNVAHAYLFTGTRGTGKTTIARIIARELGTSANDIYEMDAASNRGIDDIRELRENIRTLPFDSKYKVYIIDEVHMLTKEAFNALLKTLEEPPTHVIFILATTDLDKVPETIVSRCQTFVFKKPSEAILQDTLTRIAKSEGVKLEEGGAELLALLGDGSFRDALGALQKVMSFSKGKSLALADIELVTGAPPQTLVNAFIGSIATGDLETGLATVKRAGDQNVDMKVFLKLILHKFRLILIARIAPLRKKEILASASDTDRVLFEQLLGGDTSRLRSETLLELLEAYQRERSAFIKELPLELALVKILGKE